jgi:SAM-dependent methyltransferase
MERLEDSQLQAFDAEYVDHTRWPTLRQHLASDLPEDFRFLDVGGGTGRLADRILEEFPRSSGVVLDPSEMLLARNSEHPRKVTLRLGAEDLPTVGDRFDLIMFNWVLHHLVEKASYRKTRRNIDAALADAKALLAPQGRISVFENAYQGWVFHWAPGRIVYHMTSSRLLAPLARRGGANTAGVGVCFLSRKQWLDTFAKGGLHVAEWSEPDDWTWSTRLSWQVALHLRHIRVTHFWVRPEEGA